MLSVSFYVTPVVLENISFFFDNIKQPIYLNFLQHSCESWWARHSNQKIKVSAKSNLKVIQIDQIENVSI